MMQCEKSCRDSRDASSQISQRQKKGADRSESMVAQALFSAVPPFRHICYAPSWYPLKSISEIAMERLLPIAFCPMKMQF